MNLHFFWFHCVSTFITDFHNIITDKDVFACQNIISINKKLINNNPKNRISNICQGRICDFLERLELPHNVVFQWSLELRSLKYIKLGYNTKFFKENLQSDGSPRVEMIINQQFLENNSSHSLNLLDKDKIVDMGLSVCSD